MFIPMGKKATYASPKALIDSLCLDQSQPNLAMMVGIPGAGKSTFSRAPEEQGWHVQASDEIRKEITGSYKDQTRNSDVFYELFQRVEDALGAGKQVVADSTGINKRVRVPFYSTTDDEVGAVHAIVFVNTRQAWLRNFRRAFTGPKQIGRASCRERV